MKSNYKIVRDSIHGDIRFENMFLDFLESPELQRLHNIKQLGFANVVFPGANHTRLEHSLGVYKIAQMAAEILNIEKYERDVLTCAAILHDIGHGPFSHTLEALLREWFGIDHVDLTERIIFGQYEIFEENEKSFIDAPSVPEILENYDINKQLIVDIIRGSSIKDKNYLTQLLNSPMDVDQLDYLQRDSYYTGVAYGMIDAGRLLQTMVILNDELAIKRKGINVVENILVARGLMYSTVYFHKTVRIADLMLSRAIEEIKDFEPFEFFSMTDSELFEDLKSRGDFQSEIAIRLKYRRLFKQAYVLPAVNIDGEKNKIIKQLEEPAFRRKKEREIEEELNVPTGHIIIDVPFPDVYLSEPRIDRVDIKILMDDNKEIRRFGEFTPLADAIKSRKIPDWSLMVITDEKYKEKVAKKVENILF
jgi:hypothetical protein